MYSRDRALFSPLIGRSWRCPSCTATHSLSRQTCEDCGFNRTNNSTSATKAWKLVRPGSVLGIAGIFGAAGFAANIAVYYSVSSSNFAFFVLTTTACMVMLFVCTSAGILLCRRGRLQQTPGHARLSDETAEEPWNDGSGTNHNVSLLSVRLHPHTHHSSVRFRVPAYQQNLHDILRRNGHLAELHRLHTGGIPPEEQARARSPQQERGDAFGQAEVEAGWLQVLEARSAAEETGHTGFIAHGISEIDAVRGDMSAEELYEVLSAFQLPAGLTTRQIQDLPEVRVAPLPPASPRFTSPDLIAHASDSFRSLGTSRNSFQSLSCLRCHPEASPPLVQTAEPNSCRWGRQEIDSSSAVEPSCGCSTLTSWGSHARCAGEGMLAAGQLCEGSHEPGARSAGSGRAPAWLHLQEGMCCICLDDFAQGDLARLLPGCGHVYHTDCVDRWLLLKAACPLCRAVVQPVGEDHP